MIEILIDDAIYGALVKLFSSAQIIIFVGCTAIHPLFDALQQEAPDRIYSLLLYLYFCSVDRQYALLLPICR